MTNFIQSIKSPLLKSFILSESNYWKAAQKTQHLLPSSTALQQAQNDPKSLRPSPFQFRKSKLTGKWHPPRYSRRQQADLVKAARVEGVMHLLPTSVKNSADDVHLGSEEKPFNWQEKAQFDVLSKAPRAVAQKKFRGSLWQRKHPVRQAAVEDNLQNMQQKIDFWKKVGVVSLCYTSLTYATHRKKTNASRNSHLHYRSRLLLSTYTFHFISSAHLFSYAHHYVQALHCKSTGNIC